MVCISAHLRILNGIAERWRRLSDGLLDEYPLDTEDIELTHERLKTLEGLELAKFSSLKVCF